MKRLFTNAKIITPTGITTGEVLVAGEKIEKITYQDKMTDPAEETINLGGLYLSPGFIDIHTHGAGNAAVSYTHLLPALSTS